MSAMLPSGVRPAVRLSRPAMPRRGVRLGAATIAPSISLPGQGVSLSIETATDELQVFIADDGALTVSDGACNEWLCIPRGMSRRAFLEQLEREEAAQDRAERKRLAGRLPTGARVTFEKRAVRA